MSAGPHQRLLADVLDAGDRGNITGAVDAWYDGGDALANVAETMDGLKLKLQAAAADPTGIVFTGETARAAVVAFEKSAKALSERSKEMLSASIALGEARSAMDGAQKVRIHLDTHPPKDAGPEPRSTSSNPSQEELDKHRDWKKKEAEAQADREQRERVAREALVDLRAAYREAALPMKKIHGEPDPEPTEPTQPTKPTGGGGDGGNGGGRHPVRPPNNPEVEPPICTLPPPVVEPPVVEPPVVEPPVVEPPVTEPPGTDPDDEGTRQWTPPSDLPTGTPPSGPGGTSVSAPGGGSLGGVAAGAGLGGIGAAAGGLAAGLGGRPMAVPSGGVAASGARGALGGTPRAGGSSVLGRGATPGAPGQAATRAGARGAGAAGRGMAGKGAGGARGAAGASGARGGRGAGGASGGGGRRGGKDRDRRDATRDLFDDGQDWLDDEEQGPGVLD